MKEFWTYEVDGDLYDAEYPSSGAACVAAEAKFCDQCSEGEEADQDAEQEVFLVRFSVDDDGNVRELARQKTFVEYEAYRGDMAEHGTWHRGGAI